MIIDNRYYRIKSIFGYRLRALLAGLLTLLYLKLLYLYRVAKCHRYGRYICVKILEGWGKKCGRPCSSAKLRSCASIFQQLICSSVLKPASYDDRIFSIRSPKVALIFNLGTKHVAIYALFFR